MPTATQYLERLAPAIEELATRLAALAPALPPEQRLELTRLSAEARVASADAMAAGMTLKVEQSMASAAGAMRAALENQIDALRRQLDRQEQLFEDERRLLLGFDGPALEEHFAGRVAALQAEAERATEGSRSAADAALASDAPSSVQAAEAKAFAAVAEAAERQALRAQEALSRIRDARRRGALR